VSGTVQGAIDNLVNKIGKKENGDWILVACIPLERQTQSMWIKTIMKFEAKGITTQC
jgi:hypothetical protein